jgi:hypothetical protein
MLSMVNQGAPVKLLLLNFLIFLGFSNVYANTAKHFQKSVPIAEAAEGGASDCNGSAGCGGCCQGGSTHTAH